MAVARQAISLAPDFPASHRALSRILFNQLDVRGAGAELQKSYSLAPGEVDNLLAYSTLQAILGNTYEAVALAQRAELRDPLNPATYSREAHGLTYGRRFAQAVTAYRRALSIAPKRLIDRAWLCVVLIELGRMDEAVAENRKLPQDNLFRLVSAAIISARQRNLAASDVATTRAMQLYGDPASYQYAAIYAQRGEKDRAFAALDRAMTLRDPGLALLKVDPLVDPLRSDRRFGELLRKMNFPS